MNTLLLRVERWCWYAFLAVIPLQTRIILWQADPVFIEWRAATLFVSDVLMVALFACAVLSWRGNPFRRVSTSDWLLGLLFAAAILSLAYAEQLSVGLYALLRLAQCIALYLYLRHYAWGRFNPDGTAVAFLIGALVQALLGITQYVLQHDVGLRWFGETLLRTDMRGVAVFYDIAYQKILRAYGTMPHPNVLAAYLMVAVWVAVWMWLRHGQSSRRTAALWSAVTAVLLIGMYLTFSRTVVAVWAATSALLLTGLWLNRISGRWRNIAVIRRRMKPVLLTVALVSAGFFLILRPQIVARLTISGSDEAVRQRIRYSEDALATGGFGSLRVNWVGVGIGNFTTWLARYDRSLPSFVTQPAHNIFLMVYSELGAVGLLALLAWLASVLYAARAAHREEPFIRAGLCALVCALIVVGMLDHFFWTLQQGRILWWGALALAAGRS